MKAVFCLLFAFMLVACGKGTTDVAPDASSVAGTYDVSYLKSGTAAASSEYTLPITTTNAGKTTTVSGQMVATRQTATTVSVVFLTKITGLPDDPQSFGTLEIRGTDLYSSTTKVGTADGTNMNIDVTDNTGVRTIILSKKR